MLVRRQSGSDAPQRWALDKPVTTIGRSGDNDIVLMDREVSRHHAEIRVEGENYVIADLGSTNGTFVNDQRIARPMRLRDGDHISFAGRFELVFIDSEATAPITGEQARAALRIDPTYRAVIIRGRELEPALSPGQFAFLELLMRQPGRVYSRQEVVEAVWPDAVEGVSDQAIDALVRRLRERLAELDSHQYVVTVRGHGFRLEQP